MYTESLVTCPPSYKGRNSGFVRVRRTEFWLRSHAHPVVHTCMRNPLVICNPDTGRTAPRDNNTPPINVKTLGAAREKPIGLAHLCNPADCTPWSNESGTNRHEHGRTKKCHPFMAATRLKTLCRGLHVGVGSSAPGSSSHPGDLANHRMEKAGCATATLDFRLI